MKYLTLELLKRHCNVDQEFNDDNQYLEWLGDAALWRYSKMPRVRFQLLSAMLCCFMQVTSMQIGK